MIDHGAVLECVQVLVRLLSDLGERFGSYSLYLPAGFDLQ